MNANRRCEKFGVTLFVTLLTNSIVTLSSQSHSLHAVHLVRCLTYISHEYFPPGRSLVISSPSHYRHVQQELISEIHRTAIWPVVVTVDGNIIKPNKTDFIDKDGNYIILIPDGNIENFRAEIDGIVLSQDTFTRFWNSDARFVVAGANEFSMWQQMAIFDYLSKLRIYNCIIVSLVHYVKEGVYSREINVNDFDTSMKLGVYTWFPYQSSDRCTEVNDITLLDSWVISAQGHFTKNTDLFPRKITNSFNGCPLKAVVADGQSEFTTQYVYRMDSNGNVVTYINGLEIELLKIFSQQMNMTLVHVPTLDGFKVDESTYKRLGGAMFTKQFHIFLGGQGNLRLLVSFFDTTNTYSIVSIRWYVPCSVKYPRWSSIYSIFSVELWLVLIISIGIATISTTLVGRYSCTSEWQGYKTLTSSLTNVWAVFLGVSVSTMPRAPSLRSLFLALVCFSLAFSTVIQAFLTTFLIDSGYKTPIQNMDELSASGIMPELPPELNYISENSDETKAENVQRNRLNCPSRRICMNWAMYQKNVSILLADLEAEYFCASGELLGEDSKPMVCRLDDGVVSNIGHSMVMFYGDPLLKRVSEIIDRVVEAGIYNYWISRIMNRYKIGSQKIAIVHPLDEYYSFNLYHMQPAFYLLLMGWCISVLCFVIEVLSNRILSKRK